MVLHRFLNFVAFQAGAAAYDSMTHQDLWRQQIAQVLDHVRAPRPRRVLDLGCGPGVSSFVLARRLGPRAEVVGIDLSPQMITRARRHHEHEHTDLNNLSFRVEDATALPFEDGSFDLAVGHSFLYLVPDRRAVLAQVRRVLAPGGTLVLMEPRQGGSLVAAGRSRLLPDGHGRAPGSWARPGDALRFVSSMVAWRVFSGAAGRLSPGLVGPLFAEAGLVDIQFHPTLNGLGMHCVGHAPGP